MSLTMATPLLQSESADGLLSLSPGHPVLLPGTAGECCLCGCSNAVVDIRMINRYMPTERWHISGVLLRKQGEPHALILTL